MIEFIFFFFKQKTAYEMRISDWSSDVCSSDLIGAVESQRQLAKRSVTAGAHLIEDCGNAFAQFARDRPRRARQRGGALRVVEVGPIESYRQGAHASILSTGTTIRPRAPACLSASRCCQVIAP